MQKHEMLSAYCMLPKGGEGVCTAGIGSVLELASWAGRPG